MTMLDSVAPGICGCGRVASEPHQCECRPGSEWQTSDGWIDASMVPCPCCGDVPWCPQEQARAYAEVMAAPEIVLRTGGRS